MEKKHNLVLKDELHGSVEKPRISRIVVTKGGQGEGENEKKPSSNSIKYDETPKCTNERDISGLRTGKNTKKQPPLKKRSSNLSNKKTSLMAIQASETQKVNIQKFTDNEIEGRNIIGGGANSFIGPNHNSKSKTLGHNSISSAMLSSQNSKQASASKYTGV